MPITAHLSSLSLAEGVPVSGLSAEALYWAQLALTRGLTPTQVQALLDGDAPPDVSSHGRSAVEAAVNEALIDGGAAAPGGLEPATS